ncbi:hypothetical protein [Micromonospora sp. DPT]|uniref:hypothetical protein n=1 Tax=Micromonospora sp. DPT TaxID=3142975 RepID=UPI003207F475
MTVGDLITVPESFHRFGSGPLLMRIRAVLDRRLVEGAAWDELHGRDVRPDGPTGPRGRLALLRVGRVAVVTR